MISKETLIHISLFVVAMVSLFYFVIFPIKAISFISVGDRYTLQRGISAEYESIRRDKELELRILSLETQLNQDE